MSIQIVQALLDGILMGGVYALASLGLSLIFGVMRITNFAHGALMTVGMYAVYTLVMSCSIPLYVALFFSILIMFALGYLIQRGLLRRLDHAPMHNQILLTLGVSYIVANALLAIFTPNYRTLQISQFQRAIRMGALTLSPAKLVAFVVAIFITAAIYILLYRTRIGSYIRASSQDEEGARLMGVNVQRVRAISFGIGVVCTGIAGGLLTPILSIYPTLGETFQLKCFVVAVMGGMGNLWGALVSGLLVGVIESLTGYFLGGTWSEMMIYAGFVLILLLRPMGLFGRRNRREG